MRVRWATDAADDLERICDYIAESSPDAARRIAQAPDDATRHHTGSSTPNPNRLSFK
jgi:plasmid stabilization system protein ParE